MSLSQLFAHFELANMTRNASNRFRAKAGIKEHVSTSSVADYLAHQGVNATTTTTARAANVNGASIERPHLVNRRNQRRDRREDRAA